MNNPTITAQTTVAVAEYKNYLISLVRKTYSNKTHKIEKKEASKPNQKPCDTTSTATPPSSKQPMTSRLFSTQYKKLLINQM